MALVVTPRKIKSLNRLHSPTYLWLAIKCTLLQLTYTPPLPIFCYFRVQTNHEPNFWLGLDLASWRHVTPLPRLPQRAYVRHESIFWFHILEKSKNTKMKKTKIDMDPVSVHARIKTVGAHVETCIEIEDNQMTCVPPPGAKSDKGNTIYRGD